MIFIMKFNFDDNMLNIVFIILLVCIVYKLLSREGYENSKKCNISSPVAKNLKKLSNYSGVITNPTCGIPSGGKRCGEGKCCSFYGYCGGDNRDTGRIGFHCNRTVNSEYDGDQVYSNPINLGVLPERRVVELEDDNIENDIENNLEDEDIYAEE